MNYPATDSLLIMDTSIFKNKRVIVMGLGRFGGGIGVTRWLCRQGARVLVTDLGSERDLEESMSSLNDLDIEYRLGCHDVGDLDTCDLLVVSPAVDKVKSKFFHEALSRNIPWTSEMVLFLERCPSGIVGITGTVGKSTTTAMIGAILESASRKPSWKHGRVWLGGNIGKSLLDDLESMTPEDVVVLELSSFQLEDAARIRKSPEIALVTNFRDNHLDRHGTAEAYADAKANIYRFQSDRDWLAMPFEGGVEQLPGQWDVRPRLYRYGLEGDTDRIKLMYRDGAETGAETIDVKLNVPGRHNLQNAAGAVAVSRLLSVTAADASRALTDFSGLAHRLEFVREYKGVRYYNDSKATSPDAAITSLRAFNAPVILLVGGSDKGSSFTEFGKFVVERAKAVVCTGQTREKICAEIDRAMPSAVRPQVTKVADFETGVHSAQALSEPGDVVLLSPACASFDNFKNYEERGDRFRKIVLGW